MTSEAVLALIRAQQLAQINNGALSAAMVMELGRELELGRLTRDGLVEQLVGTDLFTHQAAVRLATASIAEIRRVEGVDGQIVAADFDAGASYGRAVGTVRDLDAARAATIGTDRDWTRDFWAIVGRAAVTADRWAKDGGRQTVMDSAEASGRGWRRVSDGNPCAFCALLVSRGAAYTSPESALTVVGRGQEIRQGPRRRGGQAKGRRARGSRGLGEKFHDHCGCTVAEVIGVWTPTEAEQQYIDLYNQASEAGMTARETTAAMRAQGYGVINDAHKPTVTNHPEGETPHV